MSVSKQTPLAPCVYGVRPSPALVCASAEGETLGQVLSKAAGRALPSGAAGGVAMGLNIMTLMWMRTTVNYQYRYGSSTLTAISALYNDGGRGLSGVLRFYRGLLPALAQGPLSRFGDTAANTGTLVILDSYASTKDLPPMAKTAFSSVSAALWRLFLMPIDTVKTTLQTDGAKGMSLLRKRIADNGFITVYNGGLGAMAGNVVGYYPWFATYNQMEEILPKVDSEGKPLSGTMKLARRAAQGFCASAVSDVCSNSIRVLKVYKQTNADATLSYVDCAKQIIAQDGIAGLFGRGLGTKLISNGIQGAMFSVLWKQLEPLFFPPAPRT
ncbi:mitochondrial carrier domain-containing protein [Pelagophyceae sp. CCMP2097]|nr:mitochondrial carrier domain-containing protein [Pelagophyceae sp. CCMP2097]